MAAAAILTAAAPLIQVGVEKLFNYIFHHAKGVESALPTTGTGATKFGVVAAGAQQVATALSTAGEIPGVLSAEQIATIVQSIVSGMIQGGQLPSSKTSPSSAATATVVAPVVIDGASNYEIKSGTLVLLKK
jgi:hypothetical protein